MILPRFNVLVPATIPEACSMLNEYAEKARVLAGGTDILVDIRRPVIPFEIPRCDGCAAHKAGIVQSTVSCKDWESNEFKDSDKALLTKIQDSQKEYPQYLVSLHKISDLKGITVEDNNGLCVKAMATITEIERSTIIRDRWTALAEGADSLGSPLVRNRGTIGGNIANARPAADMLIPSVALGGVLTLQSQNGSKNIPVEEFIVAPGKTKIETGELLAEIIFPASQPNSGSAYYKLANRKALEISTVGVAVWLSLSEPNGPIADARVTLGAVGPTPVLAESAKTELVGKIPSEEAISKAAKAAASDAAPIDDHRAGALYRSDMVETITRRLLRLALKRAKDNS